jgi:hypothetical protein
VSRKIGYTDGYAYDGPVEHEDGFWHNSEFTIDVPFKPAICQHCGGPMAIESIRLWLNVPEGEAYQKNKAVKQRP